MAAGVVERMAATDVVVTNGEEVGALGRASRRSWRTSAASPATW